MIGNAHHADDRVTGAQRKGGPFAGRVRQRVQRRPSHVIGADDHLASSADVGLDPELVDAENDGSCLTIVS